jgi:hypothetical protein
MAGKSPTYHPQFNDSTVSTLLRTDLSVLHQFSLDSVNVVDSVKVDTIPQPKPVKKYWPRKFKSDTFYIFYKQQFAEGELFEPMDFVNPDGIQLVDQTGQLDHLNGDTVLKVSEEGNHTTTEIAPALNIKVRNFISNDWILLLVLLTFFTVGWIRYFYGKVYLQTVRAAISYRESNRLFVEQNSLAKRVSFALNLVFFINFSLFIELAYNRINPLADAADRFNIFLIIIALLAGFILVKSILYWIMGFLFDSATIVREYVFSGSVYNKLAGIAYLPIILSIPYISESYRYILVNIGLIMFFLLYGLQLVRGIQIIFKNNSSWFYTILYLCTIEILPMLLLYKLVMSIL